MLSGTIDLATVITHKGPPRRSCCTCVSGVPQQAWLQPFPRIHSFHPYVNAMKQFFVGEELRTDMNQLAYDCCHKYLGVNMGSLIPVCFPSVSVFCFFSARYKSCVRKELQNQTSFLTIYLKQLMTISQLCLVLYRCIPLVLAG